jgi:hypothetical protein
VEFGVGAGDCGAPGEFDPELSEHAAKTGIMAAAATASAFADRDLPVAHLRGVTPCTVAAAQYLNHRRAIAMPLTCQLIEFSGGPAEHNYDAGGVRK